MANKTFISKTFPSPDLIKQTNDQKLTNKKIHFSETFPQEETSADTIEHENDQKVTTKSNIVTGIGKDSRNDGNGVSSTTKAFTESPKSGIYQYSLRIIA